MKKLIFIISLGLISQFTMAQVSNNNENRNYKAQNTVVTEGTDAPVFDGAQAPATGLSSNGNYKNQDKNQGNEGLVILPATKSNNESGFYASGYGKSSFVATKRKPVAAPAPAEQPTVSTK